MSEPRPTSVPPVAVVGAGIAGVACARALTDAGHPVVILDRGRRIGGRMASRRLDGRPADLGAAFFTVSDERFAAVVDTWREAGLAHPWTDTFTVLDHGEDPRATSGPLRWGTAGGIRTLVEDLAADLDVRSDVQVTSVRRRDDGVLLVNERPASAVVLAMPDPQARVLLAPGLERVAAQLDRGWDPVIALGVWWPERTWDGVGQPAGSRFHGAFVNGDPDLAWIADDGRRRGDDAPVLVAHSTPELARRHLAEPESAGPVMLAALERLLGTASAPAGHYVQRWSVARPAGVRPEQFWLDDQLVGLCGDGWGEVSRVEGAYLSGRALGEALADRLSAE